MARARSNGTFNKPLGLASGAREEERRKDEMGYGSDEIESEDVQRQLPFNKYSRNPPQPARSYGVLVSRLLWSLSCSVN